MFQIGFPGRVSRDVQSTTVAYRVHYATSPLRLLRVQWYVHISGLPVKDTHPQGPLQKTGDYETSVVSELLKSRDKNGATDENMLQVIKNVAAIAFLGRPSPSTVTFLCLIMPTSWIRYS